MQKQTVNKKFIIAVSIAVLFGLLGGITGEIISRSYLFDSSMNIPLFGAIDVSRQVNGLSNVVIRDAKKVVVEQDEKTKEVVDSGSGAMVGIFRKKNASKNESVAFNPDNYYNLQDQLGQGLILTSDGWIMTSYLFDEKEANNDGYVVITQDRKIYEVEKKLKDPIFPVYFLHVNEKNLPVRKISSRSEIVSGQSLIGVNWNKKNFLTHLNVFEKNGKYGQENSDQPGKELILAAKPENSFKGGFIFNAAGDAVGLLTSDLKALPLYYFTPSYQTILRTGKLSRPSIGVNYYNLSNYLSIDQNAAISSKTEKGSIVTTVSSVAADNTGGSILKAGDIVLSIEGKVIDKDNQLADILPEFLPGNEVDLEVLRNSQNIQVTIKIKELAMK